MAILNIPFWLNLFIEDGNIALYPIATIYFENNSLPVAIMDLTHSKDGNYFVSWTPTILGQYSVIYKIYIDEGHTIPAIQYGRSIDNIIVTEHNVDTGYNGIVSMLARNLGLSNENAVIDNTSYDACNQLIGARIRCYDSQINANLATPGGSEAQGLIASYTVNATYNGTGLMEFMRTVLN